MKFSHISDTHLGLIQYGLSEREQDVYDSFNQAIDISIKDKVDFVIFAGDVFHTPNPSGTAILQMANALKRLKQNEIESFFVLGEHDISRVRATPIPYVYHNLEFSKYIGREEPIYYKNVMIVGLDKVRKNEMDGLEEKFSRLESLASKHDGHKILVLHQGITEVNKFAGEINSTDLPKNFTYYAMGHLHDKFLKQYEHLKGPLVYPGSTDMTSNQGDAEKGFFEVDISETYAKPEWKKLDTRLQIIEKIEFEKIDSEIQELNEKISKLEKKPIIKIKIKGDNLERELIESKFTDLASKSLHFSWEPSKEDDESSILLNRPAQIDQELFKLAINALKSEKLAHIAISELLPLLSARQVDSATQVVIENFSNFSEEENDS
ncbi:MAG: DNA repair exonuclease [Thermoproteota archaeon]|nr:DNA repair exonuclease [Thermoproteota archaeon]MEC9087321.1 DNA repair exonuclease [Thermoproteota archaeon]